LIVCVFEDENYTNLLPLVYFRPTFDCRVGIRTFYERIQDNFKNEKKVLMVREYLKEAVEKCHKNPTNDSDAIDSDTLFINGTVIMNNQLKRLIDEKLSINSVVLKNGRVVLSYLTKELAKEAYEELMKTLSWREILKRHPELKIIDLQNLRVVEYPWEIIALNKDLLSRDFINLKLGGVVEGDIDAKATIYGKEQNLHIGEGASIEAYVTLDARSGPIFIGRDVEVQSFTRISGPAYIGSKSRLYSALIREGSNIGKNCRVGGEVSESIFHGYVNKYHGGYVGHSYLCEWVNVGAGTETSDLKNTYGTVKVEVAGRKVDTGLLKVGCFIGDHAKLSIGTKIYSGVTVGVASQVHGFVTENVPSFTLWARSLGVKPAELKIESAIKTQKRVFRRRDIELTELDVKLLRDIFQLTQKERTEAGVTKGEFKL